MRLTEFLLSRIAQEQATWRPASVAPRQNGKTFARRMLAECDAKRRLVARHGGEHFCTIDPPVGEAWWDCFEGDCPTMLTLASVYADHPDYQPEWAV